MASDYTLGDYVKMVEDHILDGHLDGVKHNLTIRQIQVLQYSPIGDYDSLEITGLLDHETDVSIVLNLNREFMSFEGQQIEALGEMTITVLSVHNRFKFDLLDPLRGSTNE